jgi:signal peptidase I
VKKLLVKTFPGTVLRWLPEHPAGPHFLLLACSVLWLSLALLLAATARLPGFRATIAGDSMAPGLRGVHYCIACRQCGFAQQCGLQHPPDRGLVFCANCGFRENQLEASHVRAADRVRIVPLNAAGPIQRGDCIAFRSPIDGTLAVKRVAALPRERPAIVDGDIHLNRQIVTKTLDQLRQCAILVHDDAFRPPSDIDAPGWQTVGEGTFDRTRQGSALLRGTVEYQHRTISAIDVPRRQPADASEPIRDLDAYNQSLSRKLFPVRDILLSGEFRLAAAQSASFVMMIADDVEFALEISQGEANAVWRLGRETHRIAAALPPGDRWRRFSLATCDGRFLLELDRCTFARDIPAELLQFTSPKLRMTSTSMLVRRLQIWRDIYHLHPQLSDRWWQLRSPLADDEYFVLGDNSPASTDSRQWQTGIERADILGKVFVSVEGR